MINRDNYNYRGTQVNHTGINRITWVHTLSCNNKWAQIRELRYILALFRIHMVKNE